MKVANIAIWDLETGGFDRKKNGLAEIAMIIIDPVTLDELDRYEAIIAPYEIPTPRVNGLGLPLDKNNEVCVLGGEKQMIDNVLSTYTSSALAVNGLTMKQINNGRDAKTVAKEIKAFCLKWKITLRGGAGKVVPAGHNLGGFAPEPFGFDIPYLAFFLAIFNIKYADLFNPMIIETMLWTRMKWSRDGSILNHKLTTACEAAGVELIDAHRAMNDVEGNTDLVRHFIRSLRQQGQTTVTMQKTKFREKFRF